MSFTSFPRAGTADAPSRYRSLFAGTAAAAGNPPAPRNRQRRKVLLLSALVSLPYRVLRCAHAAGADLYVLGSEGSAGLRYSRFCKKFIAAETAITGERAPKLAAEINRLIGEFGIDMVLPGDAVATRAIAAMKDLIEAPCFPLPDLALFDFLNNKWHFTKLCQELGILVPPSGFYRSRDELLAKLKAGELALPAIAKPVDWDGSQGVIRIEPLDAKEQIAKIRYAPIIVQDFIDGEDIGASVYCERGEIRSFIAHRLKRATYAALPDPRIFEAISLIAKHLKLDGVFNFDMRLARDGKIYYLECNPRFFFKMNLSMLAGINFVGCGLDRDREAPARVRRDAAVRLPKALAADLVKPWTLTRRDFRMLWYLVSDPISSLREALGIDWEKLGETAPARRPLAASNIVELDPARRQSRQDLKLVKLSA